jgi:hypothetical protein
VCRYEEPFCGTTQHERLFESQSHNPHRSHHVRAAGKCLQVLGMLTCRSYPSNWIQTCYLWPKRRHLLSTIPKPFLISQQLFSHTRNDQYLMEPISSLTCSQEPATDLYPEEDVSSPLPNPVSVTSILILSYHMRLALDLGSFIRLSYQNPTRIPLLCVPHVLHISLTLTSSF